MMIRNAIVRLRAVSRRFAGDRDGMGAIEFAILFPILVMLYVGAFEITMESQRQQARLARRRRWRISSLKAA